MGMKLVVFLLVVLIAQNAHCDRRWRRFGKHLLNAAIRYGLHHYGDEAEVADRKSVANEALNDMFDSIGKYATFKMVNDMKEILDLQEAENSDKNFDASAEDVNQAKQDTNDVNDVNNDKIDEKTLKLLELLEDKM